MYVIHSYVNERKLYTYIRPDNEKPSEETAQTMARNKPTANIRNGDVTFFRL